MYSIQGSKRQDGTLELLVNVLGKVTHLEMDRKCAEQLSEWMSRTYPTRSNNVIPISRNTPTLSLYTSTPTSERGPGTTGKELE
jgi:hypothetical protein